MEHSSLISVLYIVLLIVLSGLISASETSITSINKSKVHRLSTKGDLKAKILLKLIERKEELISFLLISNNIVNIFTTVLATAILIDYYGKNGVFYSTILMTVVIVLFAEIIPKNIALNKSDRFALGASTILKVCLTIFYPLLFIVKKMNSVFFRVFQIQSNPKTVTTAREDIRNIINMHEDEGKLHKDESDMLNAILDLKEVTVEKIMTHRKNIYSINLDETDTMIEKISKSLFSRIPIWKNNPNNIIGVLYAKNILANLNDKGQISLDQIKSGILEPWFIPETTKLKDQLNEFIQRKEKIAFVVDEYGELMGLISIEDIIEEIVGNIFDEKDISTLGIRRLEPRQFKIRGDVNIRDFNRELDLNISTEFASTLAGFIIHKTESFPEVGQVFIYDDIIYEILNKNKNQITQIKVTLPEKRTIQ